MNPKVHYGTKKCPYCGGPARWPTTGHVNKDEKTWQRFLDDENYCMLIECVGEGGGTIGYNINCKNRGEIKCT